MRTFEADHLRDAWDSVFGAIRRGEVKPGEQVRVWDQPFDGDWRDAGYVVGTAGFWGGQPCLNEIVSRKQRRAK